MGSERRLKDLYQPIWNEFSGSSRADPREYDDIMETQDGQDARRALDAFWDNLAAQGVEELDERDFMQWVGECEHRRQYGEDLTEKKREAEEEQLLKKAKHSAFVDGDEDDDEIGSKP